MGIKTLEELAKKLGVSRRTISRVLKDDKKVAEETHTRISKRLEKEKYFPNIHAASLASRKINVVGLVFPKGAFVNADFFAIDTIAGVAKAMSENNYQLMMFTQEKFNSEQCLRLYKSRLVSGLILVAIAEDDIAHAMEVKKYGVPVTLICSYCKSIDSFACNNVKGGYIATKRLIDIGRKRIAFIHGRENWFDAAERFKGYKKALVEIGMKFRREYVENGYFDFDGGETAMRKLLHLKEPPDAVFAANYKMTIGAIKVIKKSGGRIPKDIAVVGFDDMPVCEHFDPPITTVEQPLKDIAYESARVLLDLIDSPRKKKTHKKFFEPKLILRSTA